MTEGLTIPPVIVPSVALRAGGSAGSVSSRTETPGRSGFSWPAPPLPALAPLPAAAGAAPEAAGERQLVQSIVSVDDRGRIADRLVPRTMGWDPGTRLRARAVRTVVAGLESTLVVVWADSIGPLRVTGLGHLRITAPLRRWCQLRSGDRMLLTADLTQGQVVVVPPATLDQLLRGIWASVSEVTAR